jgi:hypothetical protein
MGRQHMGISGTPGGEAAGERVPAATLVVVPTA